MFTSLITMIFGLVLTMILLLNIISLPANWIILFFFIVLCFIPGISLAIFSISVLLLLAVTGEVIEAVLQMAIASKSGASTAGNWGGIVGSIIGAIVGLPFFIGIGALLGALLGAWFGCYAVERMRGTPEGYAVRAAWGAFKGKFLGFTIKIALGACMIAYGLHSISFVGVELPIEPVEEVYQKELPVTNVAKHLSLYTETNKNTYIIKYY